MRHKRAKVRSSKPAITDEHQLLQHEDFQWLSEIHKVLSPYWSMRSGYRS